MLITSTGTPHPHRRSGRSFFTRRPSSTRYVALFLSRKGQPFESLATHLTLCHYTRLDQMLHPFCWAADDYPKQWPINGWAHAFTFSYPFLLIWNNVFTFLLLTLPMIFGVDPYFYFMQETAPLVDNVGMVTEVIARYYIYDKADREKEAAEKGTPPRPRASVVDSVRRHSQVVNTVALASKADKNRESAKEEEMSSLRERERERGVGGGREDDRKIVEG